MAERSEFVKQLLTHAALKRDAQKRQQGRAMVREALPQMPNFSDPGISHNDMLTQAAYGMPTNQFSEVPTFEKGKFQADIIAQSIKNNFLNAGRHPNAAPLKPITDDSNPDPLPPVKEPSVQNAPSGAKLDPNATEEYKTAFGAGEKKMDDMLKYFGSQNNGDNLKKWAEANPALAYKEYKKAGMAGKEPFGYNDVEFGKLTENPAEAAKRAGIEKLYEGQVEQTEQEKAAQAFKNFYVDGLKGLNISKYKDMDANSSSVDPSPLLEKSVDFNTPGLAGTLGNYGTADYGELLKKYPNVFSYK